VSGYVSSGESAADYDDVPGHAAEYMQPGYQGFRNRGPFDLF
jgi:hypothetical protein